MFHFALRNQVFHRPGDVLHGHIRVHAVLIEQVDDVRPETFQSGVSHLADALRPAVQPLRWHPLLESELGRDDNFLAERLQRFAYYLFVDKQTVRFGGIKERHAAVECRPDQRDRLLPVCRGP
jgi:hypothetical protein